jgi:hypothetical protein
VNKIKKGLCIPETILKSIFFSPQLKIPFTMVISRKVEYIETVKELPWAKKLVSLLFPSKSTFEFKRIKEFGARE